MGKIRDEYGLIFTTEKDKFSPFARANISGVWQNKKDD